jgi:hypothetical protein
VVVVAVFGLNTRGTSENSGISKRGRIMKRKKLVLATLLVMTSFLIVLAITPCATLADTSSPAPTVMSISPNAWVTGNPIVVNVTGTGFQPGARVILHSASLNAGSNQSNTGNVVSDTQIICTLDLIYQTYPGTNIRNPLPLGKYDVVVVNPDGQFGVLTQGFSVTNMCGQGAGTMAVGFGLMMGLLSLGGSGFLRRCRGRKSR